MGAKRKLDRQKIYDLWKQELSIDDIAAEVGAKSSSVAQILREAGRSERGSADMDSFQRHR